MTIIGESEQGTIINGTGINWIFKIAGGTNVTLCNLTLTNGTTIQGGAIYNNGHITINDCTFQDNIITANYYGGGAIYNNGGTLIVTNSSFSNNTAPNAFGGAIEMTSGTMSIKNCYFSSNYARDGGAICIDGGTANIEETIFQLNNATSKDNTGGGAIWNRGLLNIKGCIFTGNHAVLQGGAIYNYLGQYTVNFCLIVGNTADISGNAIQHNGGSVNAEDNWWGSNNPVWAYLISGMSDPINWLYLSVNATPSTINTTQTSLITASFNNRFNGTTVTPYIPGVSEYIPNGTPVTFSLIEDIFGPYGTLSGPLTVRTSNGIASILFTASRAGVQEINASTDDENVTATVTINPASYVEIDKEFRDLPWGSVITTAPYNDQIYAIVKVHNQGPDDTSVSMLDILNGLTWTGNYYVVHAVGSYPITQDSWILNDASCPFNGTHWNIPSIPIMIGSVKWLAIEVIVNQTGTVSNYAETVDQSSYAYMGYDNYTVYLTADIAPTLVTVDDIRGNKDDTVTLRAVLTDYLGNPLAGEMVEFWIDNFKVGENTTDNTGTALFNYVISETPGSHNLTAIFNETTLYQGCNATGDLYVPSADLYIVISSNKSNPRAGENFTLTYKLGNNGPDDAENVTITIPIPEGFHISRITGDGTWNIVGNNIIWTFNNVTVGDPYLYITGWTTAAGEYIFTASIASETFSINSRGVNSLSINAQPQVNAATSNTVGMQETGTPIAGIVLAILMVLGGFISPRKKQ